MSIGCKLTRPKSVVFVIATMISFGVFAQEDARKLKLDTRRTLRLDYKSTSWNKDSNKVETSALLIRDAGSGRLAKIEVSETGANTGLFVGYYQINFDRGEQMTEITPEIYVVPSEVLAKSDGFKTASKMIIDGTLLRKPYFLRVESKSIQAISVYDNKMQAYDAYENYMKTGAGRPIVDRAALEAQKVAQLAAEEKVQRERLLRAEAERQKLEEEEKKKVAERVRREKQLNEQERVRRKEAGRAAAQQAMEFYKTEKYAEAETSFQKATELDPENQGYNFQYGVTLYRLNKFNRSLVTLEMATGPNVNPAEKRFFVAMNYMKLKEFDSAYKEFIEVKNSNDKTLAPAAAFYAGVIDYQKERYDSAKGLFEYVLDTSEDPQMDQQAETYLEQIANVMRFQELQKKKFIVSANMGLTYDSNVLSVSAANAPTNMNGFRVTYGGSVEYRPIYNQKHEFSTVLALSDYQSLTTQFLPDATLQNADPLSVAVKLPYKWKGEVFGKPYQLGLTPSYESIMMNSDGVGSRENIINSTVLALDQTFIMSENHFSTYSLEARRDVSLLNVAASEDQTANKYSLSTTQTFFQDMKKTTAYAVTVGYSMNQAQGDNQSYNKVDLAGLYFAPLVADMMWTARLAYYNSNYGKHLTGRTDNNISVNLGLAKPLTEVLSLNVGLGYITNQSISSYTYDKYTISSSISWSQNF